MTNCEYCANMWCSHNGTSKLTECKDFYGRTYIQTRKVGEYGTWDKGWYDDRIESFSIEIYDLN